MARQLLGFVLCSVVAVQLLQLTAGTSSLSLRDLPAADAVMSSTCCPCDHMHRVQLPDVVMPHIAQYALAALWQRACTF